jgi:DNA-binding transcriptional ArsR family regulator
MWEIALSLHLLRTRARSLAFDPWRRQVQAAVVDAGAQSQLSMLMTIDPPASYFPDFLTPSGYGGGLAEGIEAIRSTPASQFREQLTLLAGTRRLGSSIRPLANGESAAVARLCDALKSYHDLAIGPFRRRIDYRIAEVRNRHHHQLSTGGSEALLRSLAPLFRWQYPVLELPFPKDFDLHLNGRGLLLVPSFFCVDTPVTYFDPELPPTLVYPISHDPRWALTSEIQAGGSLALLIGESRARILEDIASAGPSPTHVLADRLHVSAPTISYHTKVLREGGLIGSERDGPAVVHHLTPLGTTLLYGATAAADPASETLDTDHI